MPSNQTKGVVGGLSVAAAAIAATLIAHYEPGANVNKPYWDTLARVPVATVCEGHTGNVDMRRIYTDAECAAFKAEDIAKAQRIVKRCLPMPMLPQIEGAATDGTYNVGASIVCGSTLQKYALENNWPAACAEFSRWDKAGGRVLRGLVLRRTDDRAVCEGKAVLDIWAKP